MEIYLPSIETLLQGKQAFAILLVFAAGILSAASPCVLAAIPLIIGYVGGYSEGNTRKAALYSFVFVLGLSTTFTVLGAAASAAGRFLAFTGQWLPIVFSAIAVLMGLHLMGIIPISMPFQRTREVKTKGLPGALMLGLLTGAVSSPCATPVLAVILAYVTTEGNVLYGALLLFVYAVGHCALIFLCGLSVGLTERIVNSRGLKNVSLHAKRVSGFVLVVTGLYIGFTR